jgi:hypothetical protein
LSMSRRVALRLFRNGESNARKNSRLTSANLSRSLMAAPSALPSSPRHSGTLVSRRPAVSTVSRWRLCRGVQVVPCPDAQRRRRSLQRARIRVARVPSTCTAHRQPRYRASTPGRPPMAGTRGEHDLVEPEVLVRLISLHGFDRVRMRAGVRAVDGHADGEDGLRVGAGHQDARHFGGAGLQAFRPRYQNPVLPVLGRQRGDEARGGFTPPLSST